ncbi:DUF885 family protein [Mucilaginibacter antarcticus]|uniref:DUF885 family protein n=1 Tax=Mucilaginibacter antarcticus TaxID=1855725 RepID=UPI00362AC9F9
MRKLYFLVVSSLFLIGCQKDGPGALLTAKGDEAFDNYKDHYLEALWKVSPDKAAGEGYHKYDSILVIPNDKGREAIINFVKTQQDSLSRFEVNDLTEPNKIDYRILQNQLEYTNWQQTVLKPWQFNAGYYNPVPAFAHILNESYAPLAKRLRNLHQKMASLPQYYKEAEKVLKDAVPELTALAIDQQTAGLNIIDRDFIDSIKKPTCRLLSKNK